MRETQVLQCVSNSSLYNDRFIINGFYVAVPLISGFPTNLYKFIHLLYMAPSIYTHSYICVILLLERNCLKYTFFILYIHCFIFYRNLTSVFCLCFFKILKFNRASTSRER